MATLTLMVPVGVLSERDDIGEDGKGVPCCRINIRKRPEVKIDAPTRLPLGVVNNDGTVDTLSPYNDSAAWRSIKSGSDKLSDDADENELDEEDDGVRTKLVDSEDIINDEGVANSSLDLKEDGVRGTGEISGYNAGGYTDDISVGVSGKELSRPVDERDPLGRKNEVSKDVSGPS